MLSTFSPKIAKKTLLHALVTVTATAGLCLAQDPARNPSQNTRDQESASGGTPVFTGKKKPSSEQLKSQEDKARQQSKIRVQSPIVTAPVTVIDSSGEFVYDLDEKDFQILDNGVPQRIQRFEPA